MSENCRGTGIVDCEAVDLPMHMHEAPNNKKVLKSVSIHLQNLAKSVLFNNAVMLFCFGVVIDCN